MADDDSYRSLGQQVSESRSQIHSGKTSRVKSGVRAAGSGLSDIGSRMLDESREESAANIHPVQYHRGGKVRKTGLARLEKGERVISRGKAKRVDRLMKRNKIRMKGGRR